MIPSQKIREIFNKNYSETDSNLDRAILDYLDEEYEKNKTPEQRQDEHLSNLTHLP